MVRFIFTVFLSMLLCGESLSFSVLNYNFSTKFDDLLKTDAKIRNEMLIRLLRIPEMFWMKERLLAASNKIMTARMSKPVSTSEVQIDLSSDQCETDFDYTLSSINEPWAIKMLDASSKLESGILYGQLYWSGNYDECLNVSAPPGKNTTGFRGRYCWLMLQPKFLEQYPIPIISTAVCIPDSCNTSQVVQYFSSLITYLETIPFLKAVFQAVNFSGISCVSQSAPWDNSAIVLMFFISVLLAIVLVATLYDLYLQRSFQQSIDNYASCNDSVGENDFNDVDLLDKDIPLIDITVADKQNSLLLCFSALKNGAKILETKQKEGELQCLHGIRFLSMTWVILGHSYSGGIPQMSNILSLFDEFKTFGILTIFQAQFAVDSFFFLSGFLLCYLFLKDGLPQTGASHWVHFYLHRYLRLTPTYAIILGAYASIWLYVGSGPFWNFEGTSDQVSCQTEWWRNLLYINNFLPSSSSVMCMGWSWYLANDMQFFVISPIFLYPLARWPIIGAVISLSLLLASWIATFVISYTHDMIPWGTDMSNVAEAVTKNADFMELIYIKPHTRFGPYLIGVLIAAYFLSFQKKKSSVKKIVVWLGWIIATAVTLLTVYGVYHTDMGPVTGAFYTALSRSAFVLGLGWLTFACLTGNGGPVNWFLTWKIWVPLSRLTYCSYLIHPMIIMWYYGSLKHTFYFTSETVVMNFYAILLITYVAAFGVALVLEAPVFSLEKHIRSTFRLNH